MRRYAAKRDANEPELVRLARQLGAVMVFAGPLDWWAGWRGCWVAVEIKNEAGRNELTESQVKFLIAAKERALPVWLWRTEDDVLRDLGARIAA